MEEFTEEIYQLQSDDDYLKCCGEIFLTIKGHLILHCTLCEEKHLRFEDYTEHLKKYHFLEATGHEIVEYEIEDGTGQSDVIQVDVISEDIEINNEEKKDEMNISEEVNIEMLEELEDEPLVNNLINPQNDDTIQELEKPNVKKKTKTKKTSLLIEKTYELQGIKKCKLDSNTREVKVAESNVKSVLGAELDLDCYHELPSCDRPRLNRSRKLASSVTSEERKHKCPYCPFASKDKTNLWSHIQRHSNNKPHQCSFCPKSFHTRVELTFHTRYHTGERPYQCEFAECGRNFVTKEQLKQHVKRHNNQRDFHCPECNKGFFSSQEVREHMVVHTKETPFKCDQCEGVFTRKKALIAHKKLHENKRSYKCSNCDAAFNQAAGLSLHYKIKHNASNR